MARRRRGSKVRGAEGKTMCGLSFYLRTKEAKGQKREFSHLSVLITINVPYHRGKRLCIVFSIKGNRERRTKR